MKNRLTLISLLAALAAANAVGAPAANREAEALAVLNNPAAELKDKARACQTLADFGGTKSIAALSALLADEKLGDYARSGLESMADPGAGAALRRVLGTLNGRQLAGAVNSLGVRRDTAAVAALGLIGNAEAAQALQAVLSGGPAELRLPAAHAAIIAAEHLSRAGNRAAVRALLEASVKAVPAGPSGDAARRLLAAK